MTQLIQAGAVILPTGKRWRHKTRLINAVSAVPPTPFLGAYMVSFGIPGKAEHQGTIEFSLTTEELTEGYIEFNITSFETAGVTTTTTIDIGSGPLEMTLIGYKKGSFNARTEVWGLPVGALAAGTYAIVATVSGGTYRDCTWNAVSYEGINQTESSGPPQFGVADADTGSPYLGVTLESKLGELLLGFSYLEDGSNPTLNDGGTSIWDTDVDGVWARQFDTPGAQSVLIKASLTGSTRWQILAVALQPAAPRDFTGIIADTFLDLAGQTPGDVITPEILAAGTRGWDHWSVSPDPTTTMSVAVNQITRNRPVFCGQVYPAGNSDRAIRYDNSIAGQTVHWTVPSGNRQFIASFWLKEGARNNGASSGLFDRLAILGVATGRYAAVQLNNGHGTLGGAYDLSIETNPGGVTQHSAGINITPDSIVKIEIEADFTSGIARLYVYNQAGVLIGFVATSMETGEDAGQVRLGNNEFGTDAGTSSYIQSLCFGYRNKFFPQGA